MPTFKVTIIGRYRNYETAQLDEFRHLFTDRGAWQQLPDKEEAGWTWFPVSSEVEAESAADAVAQQIAAYEGDAKAAGLGMSGAWNVEAVPADAYSAGTTTKKTYRRLSQ